MKKSYKKILVLSLIVAPFIFISCDKDHGTTDYDNVNDDDWKKKSSVDVEHVGNEASIITYSEI